MSYLDNVGLGDLANRIAEVFASKVQAAGNMSLSGTTLILLAVSGGQLQTIDLGSVFVTDQELQQAISDGTSGMLTQSAADSRYARSITYVASTKQLTLRDGNGNALSTVTIN